MYWSKSSNHCSLGHKVTTCALQRISNNNNPICQITPLTFLHLVVDPCLHTVHYLYFVSVDCSANGQVNLSKRTGSLACFLMHCLYCHLLSTSIFLLYSVLMYRNYICFSAFWSWLVALLWMFSDWAENLYLFLWRSTKLV